MCDEQTYIAVTRIARRDGVEFLEGLILPEDRIGSDEERWESWHDLAVDRWVSTLTPPESKATRDDRVDAFLTELGWQPDPGRTTAIGLPIRRIPVRFHTAMIIESGRASVLILAIDGQQVERLEVPDGQPMGSVLTEHGWLPQGHAAGWPEDVLQVSAADWGQILNRARTRRDEAEAIRRQADGQLSVCVREALSAGMPAARVAEMTGLSRPRIYQIRDGRR